MTFLRRCLITAATLTACISIPAAQAIPVPEQVETLSTLDGIDIRVASSAGRWDDIGAQANATSRYATTDFEGDVALKGKLESLEMSVLHTGYYISCEVDISHGVGAQVTSNIDLSQELKGGIAPSLQASVNPEAGAGATGNLGGKADAGANAQMTLPSQEITVGADAGAAAEAGVKPQVEVGIKGQGAGTINSNVDGVLGAAEGIKPTLTTHLNPGAVARVVIANKNVTTDRARISLRGIKLGVDSCLGRVQAQTFVEFTALAPAEDAIVSVLGPLRRF